MHISSSAKTIKEHLVDVSLLPLVVASGAQTAPKSGAKCKWTHLLNHLCVHVSAVPRALIPVLVVRKNTKVVLDGERSLAHWRMQSTHWETRARRLNKHVLIARFQLVKLWQGEFMPIHLVYTLQFVRGASQLYTGSQFWNRKRNL